MLTTCHIWLLFVHAGLEQLWKKWRYSGVVDQGRRFIGNAQWEWTSSPAQEPPSDQRVEGNSRVMFVLEIDDALPELISFIPLELCFSLSQTEHCLDPLSSPSLIELFQVFHFSAMFRWETNYQRPTRCASELAIPWCVNHCEEIHLRAIGHPNCEVFLPAILETQRTAGTQTLC